MNPLITRLLDEPMPNLSQADAERYHKAHQARINAQKSTGPTTPEGKARSAQNARRHGYAGATMVIADEDANAFNSHLTAYFRQFNPKTQAEHDVVRRAANAVWRADRLASIETGIEDIEREKCVRPAEAIFSDYDPQHLAAFSFMAQTNTEGQSAKSLCLRYLNAANRDFDRAVRTFYLMKKNRLSEEEQEEARHAFPLEEPETAAAQPDVPAPIQEQAAQAEPQTPTEKRSIPNEPTAKPQLILLQPARTMANGAEIDLSAKTHPAADA